MIFASASVHNFHIKIGEFFSFSSSIVIFQIRKKFHKQNSGLVIFLDIFSGEVELKKEEKQRNEKKGSNYGQQYLFSFPFSTFWNELMK